MILLAKFIILMAVHWVADFVLQTRWQAENKSHNVSALASHVSVYTAIMGPAALALFWPVHILPWACFVAATFFSHLLTDACTSRVNKYFFDRKDWHNGFAGVGFDQWIHQATLAATIWIFLL